MSSPEKNLGVAQKIKCGTLVLATVISTESVASPDINAANLFQASEDSQPNHVLVMPDKVNPQIKDIQYPQFENHQTGIENESLNKEVVIVTLPPTDKNPKPVSFYAEVLEPINGQKTGEKHIGWYDQGVRKDGLIGEENITPLVGQEMKIDFEGNGESIDCRIVASKMKEGGKVEVEIIWVNQLTKQEERGWIGIEKLSLPSGKGGAEGASQTVLEINRIPTTQITIPVVVGETLGTGSSAR
jgi:hypothetical protein